VPVEKLFYQGSREKGNPTWEDEETGATRGGITVSHAAGKKIEEGRV